MQGDEMAGDLYVLWLPIIKFDGFCLDEFHCLGGDEYGRKISVEGENSTPHPYRNDTWKWRILKPKGRGISVKITVDSLGFFYIETGIEKKEIARYIYKLLDKLTKRLILKTFLNKDIQHIEDEKEKSEKEFFIDFISGLIFEIDIDISKIKVDLVCFSYSKKNRVDIEDGFSNEHHIKISLDNGDLNGNSFNNLLNRNFDRLLKKSICFTKKRAYDSGEVYGWLDLLKTKDFENINIPFDINIDENSKTINNEETKIIINGILKKLVQDTIEESTLLYFLKVTEKEYLRKILKKISSYNDELYFQNQMLFANSKYESSVDSHEDRDENIEIFVQNLLRSIPNFHSVDNHIKEAYYIKIGNLTTDMQVNQGEGIVETYSYEKWSFSISHFIEIVDKIKESLQIYHQNKNLKELEDISYNENYQADIEDIRDLKNRHVTLDKKSEKYVQKVAIIIGVLTLSATSPIWSQDYLLLSLKGILPSFLMDFVMWIKKYNYFYNDWLLPFMKSFLVLLTSSFSYYLMIVVIFFKKSSILFVLKYSYGFIKKLYFIINFLFFNKDIFLFFKEYIPCFFMGYIPYIFKKTVSNKYIFDESDYDKHEHRSSKPFVNILKKGENKILLKYNDTISASKLLYQLKEEKLIRDVKLPRDENYKLFEFNIFPSLLKSLPQSERYQFRENYRISRFDKVSIKLMVRYKISDIKLKDFIVFVKKDNEFLSYYSYFIENQIKNLSYSIRNKNELLEYYKCFLKKGMGKLPEEIGIEKINTKDNKSLLKRYGKFITNKIDELSIKIDKQKKDKDKDKDKDKFLICYKNFVEKEIEELSKEVGSDKAEIKSLEEQERIIEIIYNSDDNYWKDTKLNFYIVYSFSLKLKGGSKNNRYDYFVFKDQSRVHFHLSHLYYNEDLEKEMFKQEKEISEIIYIYFLARMKKFNHDLS